MELDCPPDARHMPDTQLLAGVTVPHTSLIERAMEHARQKCEPYLFNHVMRSWLFAVRFAQGKGIPHDAEIVAVGTLLTILRSMTSTPGRAGSKSKLPILCGHSPLKRA